MKLHDYGRWTYLIDYQKTYWAYGHLSLDQITQYGPAPISFFSYLNHGKREQMWVKNMPNEWIEIS